MEDQRGKTDAQVLSRDHRHPGGRHRIIPAREERGLAVPGKPAIIAGMKERCREFGYTLVELIIVIAILAVLLLLIVPQVLNYVEQTRAVTCRSNRRTLRDAMIARYAMGTIPSLSQSELDEQTARYGILCPDGGTYTWVSTGDDSGTITCSRHPDTGEGETGVQVTDSDHHTYTVTGTREWSDVMARYADGQVTITPGTVIHDASGLYIYDNWNNVRHVTASDISLADFQAQYPGDLIKVTSATTILTASDTSNGAWKSAPAKGSIACMNGSFYIAPGALNIWTLPPSGWIRIDSGIALNG